MIDNFDDSIIPEQIERNKRKDKVREIEIDPEIIREMQEAMELTGEFQFSTAPDPNDQDKKKENVMGEAKNEVKPVEHVEEGFCASCCGSQEQNLTEQPVAFIQAPPTSKYVVCCFN